MKDKICEKCGRIISYDTYFKRYVCRQCGYEENPIDNKGWHVVADGDLPEKVGNYLVTVERTFFGGKYPRGRVVREVLQAYFKRDDSYIVGYVWWSDCAGLDDRDVLAWQELPEPWEGVNNERTV